MAGRRDRRRSRAVRVGAALVVTAVVATTASVFIAVGGDGDDGAETANEPELTGTAKELADALEKRETAVYHARYEGSAPAGGTVVIETWQRGVRTRQDQIIRSGADELHVSSFALPTGRVTCLKAGADTWSCQRSAAGEQQATDPFEAIRSRIGQGRVTARDDRVEGRPVRCYRFTVQQEDNELCLLSASGIPVRIRGGTTELRLVSLENTVDESALVLPAPVQS